MSIGTTTNRNDYTGAGTTGPFAYGFKIFAAAELAVVRRDTATNIETPLSYPADYSVAGVGDGGGGSITTTVAVAAGQVLTIRRGISATQPTSIRNQGAYYPATIEDEFDRLTMIDQRQQDELDRSIKLPPTVAPSTVSAVLPVPVAGGVLAWNGNANGLTTADAVAYANISMQPSAVDGDYATSVLVGVFASGLSKALRLDRLAGWLLRLRGVYSVKDPKYGAVGDGVTDDTAALQAAATAAAATAGAALVFPAGHYKHTATISVTGANGLVVRGDHAILDSTGLANTTQDIGAFDVSSSTGVHVQQLHFKNDGNIENLTVRGCSRVNVHNNTFEQSANAANAHMCLIIADITGGAGPIRDFKVHHNTFLPSGAAIRVRSAWTVYTIEDSQITDNLFDMMNSSHAGSNGTVKPEVNVRQILIARNIFEGRSIGGQAIQPNAGCSAIQITNNLFKDWLEDGVRLDVNGGIVGREADMVDIGIGGNTFINCQTAGILTFFSNAGYYLRGLNVHDNVFDGCGSGFYEGYAQAKYQRVAGNIIRDCTKANGAPGIGIQVLSANGLIIGNLVSNDGVALAANKGISLQLQGGANIVAFNQFLAADQTGATVTLASSGNHSVFRHNVGIKQENMLLSAPFAIDATGVKTVTVTHGLALTPTTYGVRLSLVQNTAVDDFAIGWLKVVSVDATNITIKVNVTTASLTAGATAEVGVYVDAEYVGNGFI